PCACPLPVKLAVSCHERSWFQALGRLRSFPANSIPRSVSITCWKDGGSHVLTLFAAWTQGDKGNSEEKEFPRGTAMGSAAE
ncbi:hypothetical protein, partial [Thermogutta sp.]|uniref:hypothetical protein n=1 Tax=Thermogutta sp. TaxID=1962930 RepID=UPI0025E4DEBB